MPAPTRDIPRQLAPLFALIALAMLVYWGYSFGFSGSFIFDDRANLNGLERVHDLASAQHFIFDGQAGPLGRPISLASFILDAPSWPSTPATFFRTNTLLHLLNGVLLFWLAWQMARLLPQHISQPGWFALAVSGLWLIHPLWVSTSFLAVQRMTSLSATFMLAGLLGYLKGRQRLPMQPMRGMAIMTTSLVMATLLATYSKETGVLLIFYAATLEILLGRLGSTPGLRVASHEIPWKRWSAALIWLPLIGLWAYVAWRWQAMTGGYGHRDFQLHERILTETRILWSYIGQLVFPRPLGISPFHDGYPVSQGLLTPVTTLFAILGWGAVGVAAFLSRVRYPLITFAVLWFLLGHQLESSVFPLELYFEHRNYFPSIGLFIAAVTSYLWANEAMRRMLPMLAGLYAVMMVFVLVQTTQIWGNPRVAAQLWVKVYPQSSRAWQHLATQAFQDRDTTLATIALNEGARRLPNDTGLALQAFYFSCPSQPPEALDGNLAPLLDKLKQGRLSQAAPDLLKRLVDKPDASICPGLDLPQVIRMIDALAENPKYRASRRTLGNLYFLKGRAHEQLKQFSPTLENYEQAFNINPDADLAVHIAGLFLSGGLPEQAIRFLERAEARAPGNTIMKSHWEAKIQPFKQAIMNMPPASRNPDAPR